MPNERRSFRDRPNTVIVLLVGAFGGIAPVLLRIAVDLSQKNQSLSEVNVSVALGMAIFAIMGAIVAAIWHEVDLRKVFYIGLGLPSLITVAASTSSAPPAAALPSKPPTVASMSWAEGMFRNVSGGSSRRVKIVLPPEVGYNGAEAIFYLASGSITTPIRAGEEMAVPDEANAVMISSPVAPSERIALGSMPAGSVTTLRLAAQKDPLFGLRYAVGLHSKPFRLSVSGRDVAGTDERPGRVA